MKLTRRTLQSAAALALLGAFAATPALAQTPGQNPPKIALVMKSMANEFARTMDSGARAHQKAHAAQYTLVANGIKDETDTSAQIKLVEQMLSQKIDALVIAPADSKALVPVVKAAIDRGILVVNIDNKLDADALKDKGIQVPFVGPDDRGGARQVGDYLGKSLKAGDKVAIIEGVPTTFNAQQRTLGHRDAMKAAGIDVVSVQSGAWEIDKASTVASSLMREHPDLKALLCGNDSMALGAVAAVRAAGKTGKVLVVGYDDISAVKPMLADGRLLATADQSAVRIVTTGIETALKALADKQTQATMPPQVITSVALVTKQSK